MATPRYQSGLATVAPPARPQAAPVPRRRALRPPRLYRYRPVPPVGFDDEGYPCEDSMSQNVSHAKVSNYLASALERHCGARAFVGDDLMVLYRKGDRGAALAPDTFVAFGADKAKWKSYKLWEQPVPSFVLEVVSEGTKWNDVGDKKHTYETLGVEEFWLFDPAGMLLSPRLEGHRLSGGRYRPLQPNAAGHWRSEAVGLELRLVHNDAELAVPGHTGLRFHDPNTGEMLRSYGESVAEAAAEREARRQAEGRADAEQARRQRAEERAAAEQLAREEAERQLTAALAALRGRERG